MDDYIRKCLITVFRFFRIDIGDEATQSLNQFIKFGIVGVTNTVISYLLNIGMLKILEPYRLSWDYVIANLVAFFISVLWSFYWNNRYVFISKEGEHRNIARTVLKTYISYGFTGIFLTNVLAYVWIDILGVSKYLAPIINLIISVPLNFIINKRWAFNN